MSKREVAELACRILALWFLVANLHSLVAMPISFFVGVWALVSREGFNDFGITLVLTSLLFGFIAFVVWFLWTRSAWIASKLVSDDATHSRWPHMRVADLQVAAFSTVGLFVLIRGLRYFVHTMGIYFDSVLRRESSVIGREFSILDVILETNMFTSIISLVVGMWLLLGSRGLVRFIRRLRRPRFEEDEPAESIVRGASAE